MVFAGILSGYVCYDMVHYFLHHSNPQEGTWAKHMKIYHMQHHYKNGLVGFGDTKKVRDITHEPNVSKAELHKND